MLCGLSTGQREDKSMQISSYELAHCANYMVSELKKIRDKIDFYAKEELKKGKALIFLLRFQKTMMYF